MVCRTTRLHAVVAAPALALLLAGAVLAQDPIPKQDEARPAPTSSDSEPFMPTLAPPASTGVLELSLVDDVGRPFPAGIQVRAIPFTLNETGQLTSYFGDGFLTPTIATDASGSVRMVVRAEFDHSFSVGIGQCVVCNAGPKAFVRPRSTGNIFSTKRCNLMLQGRVHFNYNSLIHD